MIAALEAISVCGWLAGFLLLRRIPILPPASPPLHPPSVAVIIPARNEEVSLPALLASLRQSQPRPDRIVVADDDSSDHTAEISRHYNCDVVSTPPLPPGWTGKTWACSQAALAVEADLLFFLDADTCFTPGGYARTLAHFLRLPSNAALSVLPFHAVQQPYESLSLFFNLLTAIGAGGFTGLGAPLLFGPSLLIRRELYLRAGGHRTVQSSILENLAMARSIVAAGGLCRTVGGRGALLTRMFPHGFRQLRESWQKAFASGAKATPALVLALSIFWLAAAALVCLLLIATLRTSPALSLSLYLAFALQIFVFCRQLGAFPPAAALLYPIPLAFYFYAFAGSALRRGDHSAVWKGRQV